MEWNIGFISLESFKAHVKSTISHYGQKIEPYSLKRFNANTVDPVKLLFDRAIYSKSWTDLIASEVLRQRDKSNTNEIGYFHQGIFGFIRGCSVPANGAENGWDVIVNIPDGYALDNGDVVHKIYVEMKNKHNTMNSAAAAKTYIKMQSQLLDDDDCACFLVEVIAKKSQNIRWTTTVDKKRVSHSRIRRVSIDRFYEVVTGEKDAFYKICMALPAVIRQVLREDNYQTLMPQDTVEEELREICEKFSANPGGEPMLLALYALAFPTYQGFDCL